MNKLVCLEGVFSMFKGLGWVAEHGIEINRSSFAAGIVLSNFPLTL